MNKNSTHIKVIIAGGGTGGHIFPAIAIAHALRRKLPSCEILFVGAKGKMEMEKVPQEGYTIEGLDIAGWNRSSIWKNIGFPFKVWRSLRQARAILKRYQPDIAIGVGGYASFPVLFMAQRQGVPTLIQEQNSFAGVSNRILGKRASSICVAYPDMQRFFPASRIVLTGNPVRKQILENQITREEAIQFFQLRSDQNVVLVIGGSLGARSINNAFIAQALMLVQKPVQLLWQTGQNDYTRAVAVAASAPDKIKVHAFIREMDYAFAAADIIISRAGASSIAELCIVGKPVIFVPYPYASEDHQTHNAMALVQHNAALLVRDHEAVSDLLPKLEKLLQDEQACTLLRQNISALRITDADTRIANEIIRLVA